MSLGAGLLSGIIFVGILVSASGAVHVATDSSQSCTWCHGEHGKQWASSTHKAVECVDCHIQPGIGGAVKAKVQGLQNLYVSVIRGNEVKRGETPVFVDTKNCIECHGGILYLNELGFADLPNNSLKVDGLVMAHRKHVEKHKIDCIWCHRGTVHRDPEIVGKYPFNMPLHSDCDVCHNGEYLKEYDMTLPKRSDENECIICHPTYEPQPPDEE